MSGSNSATCRSWGAGRSRSQPTSQPCWCASEPGWPVIILSLVCREAGRCAVRSCWRSHNHVTRPCSIVHIQLLRLAGRTHAAIMNTFGSPLQVAGLLTVVLLCCREGMQRCLQRTRRGLCRSGWWADSCSDVLMTFLALHSQIGGSAATGCGRGVWRFNPAVS